MTQPTPDQALGIAVRRALKTAGINQRDAHEAIAQTGHIDFSEGTLQRSLRGARSLKIRELHAIAKVCNTSVSELTGAAELIEHTEPVS